MDDRKSTTSSFFGRKSSFDALNQEQYNARDDANSFFQGRPGGDSLSRPSAGYNRNSFFHVGREEPLKGGRDEEEERGGDMLRGDEGWDIYADFNNAGPRYSTTFGTTSSSGYQPLEPPHSPSVTGDDGPKTEMVTVPVHGAEWTKRELHDMTKAGKRERKMDKRREMWKSFVRGNNGCCGVPWLTRKVVVITIFVLMVIIGVIIGICFPRVPSFGIDSRTPLINAGGTDWNDSIPITFERAPTAKFSFPAFAQLQMNTQENFLPLTFSHLYAEVTDLQTYRQVATGDLGHYKVPAKSFPEIRLPLNFTYAANNDTDQTWANYYNACRNRLQFTDGRRPGLGFKMTLTMSIIGYPGHPKTSAEISNAGCPIELPNNF